MKQKVEFFEDETRYRLEQKINEFAETHHIESISYAICKFGYTAYYSCCVLYTD